VFHYRAQTVGARLLEALEVASVGNQKDGNPGAMGIGSAL
jgi:hypothetical protein